MARDVMHIGFTGTQKGMTRQQQNMVSAALAVIEHPMMIHHGSCIGADEEFHELVRGNFPKAKIIGHPGYSPSNPSDLSKRAKLDFDVEWPPKPFLVRNRDIVDLGWDLLIATPSTEIEVTRSGTWSTIRHAKKNRRKLFIITPMGHLEVFREYE